MKKSYVGKFLLIFFLLIFISFSFAGYFDYDDVGIGCSTEVCDGVDNDCDNIIDNLPARSCQITNPTPSLGTCSGTQLCGYGLWLNCDTTATQSKNETCNNLDDDCDGIVDETWPLKGTSCGNCGTYQCNSIGTGLACTNTGVCTPSTKENAQCGTTNVGECQYGIKEKTCTNTCGWGNWTSCSGNIEPTTETCDGKDNDCDGQVDEGCDCINGATKSCGSNVGECSSGTQTCVNGKWNTTCTGEIKPQQETCGGKDLDCDGIIDNGCTCTNGSTKVCGTNVGECSTGIQTCTSGNWGACVGNIGPKTEICDGLDNDCTGVTDPGCSCTNGSTRSCGKDTGNCVAGTQTCTSGNWGLTCVGEVGPIAEICNNIDDDCDGTIDNLLPKICGSSANGLCKLGTQTCTLGNWNTCNGNIEPTIEKCDSNNFDEDCDGVINNGCACISGTTQACGSEIGICQKGNQTCTNGTWGNCSGGIIAVTEICANGLDEDCDGIVDNGCTSNQNNNETGPPTGNQNDIGTRLDLPDTNTESSNYFENGTNTQNQNEYFPQNNNTTVNNPPNNENKKTIFIQTSKYSGSTTNFNNLSSNTIINLTLEKPTIGKIVFNENIVFDSNINIDNFTEINTNSVFVDSTNLPLLNKKAKITLYNITAQNPIILKDGQPCPISECKINSISQGEIEFEVEHFTTYSIGDADNFTCLEGEIKNSCVCGEEIFSTGFCCNSSAQNYDCEDYPPIEPIMVVEMCYDDIEGECVTIGDVTGTCIDGNFEEGCKRKKTDPLTGINKFLEENQMIIFGLGGLLVLMIIVLIANTIISKKSKNKKTKRNEPKKNISNQEFYTSQKQKNILAQKPPIKSDKGKSVNQNNFNEIVIKEIKKQKTKEEILKELRNELK